MRTETHVIPMSRARRAELLARTYVLHIVPERAPEVSRTTEMLATQTLAELHNYIQREFKLDNDHLYAFYMSGRAWDKKNYYDGPGKNAERISLQVAGCKPGKEFLYIFDFGDDLRHHVRVESQGTRAAEAKYPRTLAAIGKPPPQYQSDEEPEVEDDLLVLADEAAKACAEREHELYGEGPCGHCGGEMHRVVDAKTLTPRLELEQRLREALSNRPEQMTAFEAYCEYRLLDWLSEVIFDLAESGQGEAAIRLYDAWSDLARCEESELGSRAKLLLRAGQPEAAKAEADRQLSLAPQDFHSLSIAVDIYRDCGDLERAETICRRYYELAEDAEDAEDQMVAGHQLAELLRDRGKKEEAEALEAELEAKGPWDDEEGWDEEGEDDDEFLPVDVAPAPMSSLSPAAFGADRTVIAPPKIGRNELCPCGSGKKYKRCCGG